MSSQTLRNDNGDEPKIERDLCYEADPYELKLDEMFDAEPEPEIIEGLPASDALTPADRYLELFTHVQKSRIFADSKTFPDCAPKQDPLDILIHYRRVKHQPGFDLRQFVEEHFWMPDNRTDDYVSDPRRSLKEHIDNLWPVLTREPQDHIPGHRCWRCRSRISCPAGALAKPTTGTPTLLCWGWRKAAAKTC
jgi:alpha,alpha-trehalase